MSKHPGVSDTLELLEKLKALVRDFAAREEKLNREFRLKAGAEETAFAAETERRATEFRVNQANEDATFHARQDRREENHKARQERILKAHASLRKKAFDSISEGEGARKARIQKLALDAERRREKELAAALARRNDFHARLAETNVTLSDLERAAEKAFSGYPGLKKLLAPEQSWPEPDLSADDDTLHEELLRLIAKTRDDLAEFEKKSLPKLVRVFGKSSATPAATAIAGQLAKARRLHDACFQKAETRLGEDQQRVQREFDETNAQLSLDWKQAVKTALDLRGTRPLEIDEKAQRITGKHEQFHRARVKRLREEHAVNTTRLKTETEAGDQEFRDAHVARMAEYREWHEREWQKLETEWNNSVKPLYDAIRAANEAAEKLAPDWEVSRWQGWTPPEEFKNAARFAQLQVDLEKFAETLPKDPRLALPGPANFSVPLSLTYPRQGSILFEAGKTGNEEAIQSINNIIFRMLSTIPPGKLSLTIFDPVGLGQNFAGLMHLADYEESHINSRIWTQQSQFEEKLSELNEHMEKVIQMYLRNEYETIAEYNAQAGTIAEKYHVLVIASFPVNFSDTAARRLRNIATSGARCGVYTLIHWDQRNALPHDFVPDELRKNSVNLVAKDKAFEIANWRKPGTRLALDAPPSPEFATHFLHEVGKSGKDSNRVEVPFEHVAPGADKIWTGETTEELRVPIGRSGATKFQYLEIGKGTRQHALVAGKTGSGKSTLFHIIITNLSLWCSPEQVEFYLVDFKKGVEFKCYASRRLPHAKVVAIESDRAFGLSVLERVDAELRRRGDLFRELGVQDVAGYKRAGGKEPMPRSLLLIDEFQEFFTEEDRVSQGAAVLLDRIVRQGRAFGIHVILGSQTLGGAYTLARATLGQMVIRIALQCNEADAYLIMDQDNPAPRLLSRPGEGIYNDAAGALEGNSPFQAVWLADDVRDKYLEEVRERANQSGRKFPGPFVFEGNAPADVRENTILNELLKNFSVSSGKGEGRDEAREKRPLSARVWLGSPNSIKGPTEATFQRQSGGNLLIVGQNEDTALSMLAVALVSLAAQYPRQAARFVVLDSAAPGSPQRDYVDRVVAAIPHEVIRAKSGDIAEIMNHLAEDLKHRGDDEKASSAPETFVLVYGLQNYKKLRQEDDFSFSSSSESTVQPSAVFLSLISDGPARGFHVIATCDTYNNVNRFLGRKNLSEFEMRVLFQMSASDSASLIDAPEASTLGLHRALYYNDREGYTEIFRPYARPGYEWIDEVMKRLKPPT